MKRSACLLALILGGAFSLVSDRSTRVLAADAATGQDPVLELALRLSPSDVRIDDATIAKRQQATLAWYNKILVKSYDSIGARSPKWDEAARKGLTYTARLWSREPTRPADTEDEAWYWLHRAVDQGCTDPLVRYLDAFFSASDRPTLEAANRLHDASYKLLESDNAPFLWGTSLIWTSTYLAEASVGLSSVLWEPRWNSILVMINAAHELLPKILADRETPTDTILSYIERLQQPWVRSHQDRKRMFDHIEEEWVKVRDPKDPLLTLARARFLVNYAWDEGHHGIVHEGKSPREGLRVFRERLQQASAEAARAVATGSNDLEIVRVMNEVSLGLGAPETEFERWFQLGVRMSPAAHEFHATKLAWLMLKRNGADEAVLAFGREARKSDNWAARIPLVLVEAHEQLIGQLNSHEQDRAASKPEVCADVLDVYAALLERYPHASSDRATYVNWLAKCGKWVEANKQLQMITPDRLRLGEFGGQEYYDELKRRVEREAKTAGGGGKGL